MGNRNIEVDETLTRNPPEPAVEVLVPVSSRQRVERQIPLRTERPRISGGDGAAVRRHRPRQPIGATKVRAAGRLPRSQKPTGAAVIRRSRFRIRSLDELAAFLNGGIAAAPRHDWHRGG